MNVILSPIQPADQPLLWEFLYLAIFVPEGSEAPALEVIHRPEISLYAEGWGQPGDMGFIAREEANGEPVGAAWLRLWEGERKGYGFVGNSIPELTLAVQPGFRGIGIGSQLLERMLSAARGHFPAVSLSVFTDNPAIRLYRRFGFFEVRLEGDAWVMQKDLEPDAKDLEAVIAPGNARVDGKEFGGWFIGDLNAWSRDRRLPVGENEFRLRSSTQVEVKWGHHPWGQRRPGGWAQPSEKIALSLLVSGRFLLEFRDPSNPSQVVKHRLEGAGDYVLWRETIEHSWLALEDSTILTVRWREKDQGA